MYRGEQQARLQACTHERMHGIDTDATAVAVATLGVRKAWCARECVRRGNEAGLAPLAESLRAECAPSQERQRPG